MSTVVSGPPSAISVAPPLATSEPYRLSVAQYHEMARAGVLKSGDPVELLEGILVRKMTLNNAHMFAVGHLFDLMVRSIPDGWFANCQMPITTTDSEPEPDIAVVRGERRRFLVQDRKPGPADIEFLIDVSDSSLTIDRTTKLQIYARAEIRQYWIVDEEGRQVAVYSDPTGPGAAPIYRHRQDFVPGQEILVLLAGREVGRVVVADLFL